MTKFEEFARVRMDPCTACGKPLLFCSQFKKFGEQRVEVCEFCKTVRHNGKIEGDVEVGP